MVRILNSGDDCMENTGPKQMNYIYLFWHQNLHSAEPQQVLFAMWLPSVNKSIKTRNGNFIPCV